MKIQKILNNVKLANIFTIYILIILMIDIKNMIESAKKEKYQLVNLRKELFGDEEKYYIGKVEYCGSTFIVDVNNNSEYHVYDLDGFGVDSENNLEDSEVIGNVWDNPELLNYFEEEEEWEE